MNFQEAQEQYRELERQYQAREINESQYRQALSQLRVIDQQDRAWEMQAHTGRWHVYIEEQWRPSLPPILDDTSVGAMPSQPNIQPRTASGKRLVWALGISGVLLVCVLAAVFFGLRALSGTALNSSKATDIKQTETVAEPTSQPLAFTQIEVSTAAPGGGLVTDSHDVSLLVPEGAVEEGKSVQLTALDGSGGLVEAFEGDFHIDTLFYQLKMPGEDDGQGQVELSFPAANPAARVLVVIDGQYPGLLDIAPENGRLTVNAQPYPSPGEGAVDGDGEVYFAVVSPAGTSQRSPADQLSSAPYMHLASLADRRALPQQEEVKRCFPELHWRGGVIAHCRENGAGTVQVKYYASLGLSEAQADAVVREVAEIMGRYGQAGFKSAVLSPSSPLHVVITDSVTSPFYRVLNGVLYITPDDAKNIEGGAKYDLWHEMAHWIQDAKYNMTWAYYSGAKTWWLEVAAENMVMLLDEAYVGVNLTIYGKGDLDNGRVIFQGAPFIWPDDESYIQAQLLKVNLCDDAMICPLSAKTFAEAISSGIYPLESSEAQAQVNDNLDDYARYLLGAQPEFANSTIPLNGAVQSGEGYGDYVQLYQNTKSLFANQINGSAPQMVVENSGPLPVIAIEAQLEKDSVYPLRVFNVAGDHPALPAMLTIQAGAPFWYRLGGGDPLYHDGSKELVLSPIHPTLGYQQVRVAALGEAGGEVFKARVTPADFSGVWAFQPGKILTNNVNCTSSDESGESGFNVEGLLSLGNMLPIFGDYTQEGGTELNWTLNTGRLLEEMDLSTIVYQVEANLDSDGVHAHNYMQIPQDASGFIPQPGTGWQALLILPGAAITLVLLRRISRKRSLLTNLSGLVAIALLPVACSGYFGMYGSIDTKVDFQKIEYQGNAETVTVSADQEQTPAGLWRLTGVATSDLDFTAVGGTVAMSGEEQETSSHCAGNIEYEMTVIILRDIEIDFGGE